MRKSKEFWRECALDWVKVECKIKRGSGGSGDW